LIKSGIFLFTCCTYDAKGKTSILGESKETQYPTFILPKATIYSSFMFCTSSFVSVLAVTLDRAGFKSSLGRVLTSRSASPPSGGLVVTF
jgi:hypothetical protein